MRYKFFYGYWGCTIEGMLFSPTHEYGIKLPKWIAFKIHTFLNKFAWTGIGCEVMLFGKMPSYQLYYNPKLKSYGFYREEYLMLFGRKIKKLKDYKFNNEIAIKKIKCELRLKHQMQ